MSCMIPNIIEVGDPFSHRVEEVRVNGKRIDRVFYVNLKKGLVRAFVYPFKVDKHRKRALHYTLRGKVEVITRD
jgi:hypothetical protein